jgi:uncharacterized protein (DUF4415 family)
MKPMSISEIRTLKDETDWERLRNMDDSDIDFSDIPPLDEGFFRNAVFRPPRIRKMVSIRLEEHVLNWFKRQGSGYQTRIQSVLRQYVVMAERAMSVAPGRQRGTQTAKKSGPAKRKSVTTTASIASKLAGKPAAKPRKKPRASPVSSR